MPGVGLDGVLLASQSMAGFASEQEMPALLARESSGAVETAPGGRVRDLLAIVPHPHYFVKRVRVAAGDLYLARQGCLGQHRSVLPL